MFRLLQSAVLILGVTLGTGDAPAAPSQQTLDTEPQRVNGRRMLPAWETTWERRALLRKDSEGDVNGFRMAHPQLYAASEAPAQPARHYAEYDPVDAIYYAWEPGLFNTFFGAITTELLNRTTIQIHILHHGPGDRAQLEAALSNLGHDPSDVTFVDVAALGDYYEWQTELPFDRSLESFWMVDYGPAFVEDGSGVLAIVDPRYYTMRVNDDAVPTKIAGDLGVTVFRPDIGIEGGNLFSDGRGTCFTTGMVVAENGPQSEADLSEILRAYFGCEKTIWLWPLYGEPTGHIDMFFKNASATTLLVGRYDPAVDPDNAALLDMNAQILAAETNADGSPFQILRVPMPDNADDVWRTYLNGIVVNDLVLVPTYPDYATNEASALAVLGQAFGGRTVVGLDSEAIIWWGGAIHCVTRTRPVATHTPTQAPPADLCAGGFDCTGGCGELTQTGECFYGVPAFCDAGQVLTDLCAPDQRCGWLAAGGYFDCVDADCGAITAAGECHRPTGWDEVVVTCSASGFPEGRRCPAGTLCAVDGTGVAGCEACADNECTTGDGGCDTDDNAWRCGRAEEGDNCLRVITSECTADEVCSDGQCRCTDECQVPDLGCNADGDAWSCGEAGDGDSCTDRVVTPCRAEETCVAGVCECDDQCSAGEQGCDADGNAYFCGEADDGDSCTDRVVTTCGLGTECRDATCVVTLNPREGCGCAGGESHGPEGPLVLLMGLLWLSWRRRRRGGVR